LRWLLPFPKTEQNTDFGDPARWKNAIVRRRLQFLAAVIDGEGQHVSERIGQEEEICPTSAHRLAPRASESYASHERLAWWSRNETIIGLDSRTGRSSSARQEM